MNFDSTFDFEPSLIFLKKQLDVFTTQSSDIDTETRQLKQCKGFAHVTGPELKSLESKKSVVTTRAQKIQSAITSIQEVQTLSQQQKASLLLIHALVNEDVSTFMARMLSNHAKILTDKDIQQLLVDTKNTAESKVKIGQCLLVRYQPDSKATFVVTSGKSHLGNTKK